MFKTEIQQVEAALKKLDAVNPPTPFVRDAIIRGRVFLRALNQANGEKANAEKNVVDLDAQIAEATKATPDPKAK